MKKSTKGLLITGALLILFGIIIFTGVMAANHWDFSKLSTVQLVSSTYQVDDKFDDISLKTDVEDIIFLPSDDGKCRVVCDEPKNVKAAVSVQGKTLTINTTDNEKKNFYKSSENIAVYTNLWIYRWMVKWKYYFPGNGWRFLGKSCQCFCRNSAL